MNILTRLGSYDGTLPEWWVDEKGRPAIGFRVKGDINKPDLEPRFKKIEENEIERDVDEGRERARKRFDAAIQAESLNRQKAVICLQFKSGDQWEPDLASERAAARRPRLTINKIPTFVNQVVNDQRQNRPSINVSPIGDVSPSSPFVADPRTIVTLSPGNSYLVSRSRTSISTSSRISSSSTMSDLLRATTIDGTPT
jgi:hypothetical protein